MTKLNNIGTFYRPSTLGFERLLNEIEKAFDSVDNPTTWSKPNVNAYPPHNIIKTDANRYIVELAIAGFAKEDIEITIEDGYLKIKGSRIEPDSTIQYLHRGIGTRSFTKTIQIADTIEVRGAEFKDGILRIGLENVIPEHKKPKKIEIGNTIDFTPQLLTE